MTVKRKTTQESLIRDEAVAYKFIARTKNGRRANLLDGKTWTKYSISIWSDIKKTREEIELNHPAIFPLQLAQRLIECFTNPEDEVILDPFAGVGTTVVAADRLNKSGVGIEISAKFAEVANRRLGQRELFSTKSRA